MFKYLELAVDLRKSYVAKEGIFQYKLICQQTNIKSFEDVVRRYIDLAEEKAEYARNRAASQSTNEVDDLDSVQTPEEILLSAVSSEDQQDRSERVVLIPWVRFLWEAYRQCLDILRNNVRTEILYHEIAHRAFQFCTKFNRKTEFRKLCDNLRTHMDYLKKTQSNAQQNAHSQSHMVNLNNPESLAMHLETRLIQLESATQIELWQEAYRATDDIKRYGLMNLNKKPPKPQLMANYYQKLALVFWKADCHLFHAATLFRLYYLTRELKKNITPEEVQRMASKLVLATLTIPVPANRPDIDKLVDTEDNTVESHQRNLASLLGLTTVLPSRNQLVKDLKRMGYLQHAYGPLQDLYKYLEVDFNPLALCGRVQSVIQFIDEKCDPSLDLKNYIPALKNLSILRLLKGVSQVYQTIEYKRLSELCPFADNIYLETMVVEAARRNDLQVRIDHRKNNLHFGTDLCVSQAEEVVEGPHLQSMPSEQVRLQLVNTYSTLLKARSVIEPDLIEKKRESLRVSMYNQYLYRKDREHDAILARQGLIEERKKQLELLGHKLEQEERLRQEAKQRKLAKEELLRLQQEKELRENQIKEREMHERISMSTRQKIEAAGLNIELDGLNPKEMSNLWQDVAGKKVEQAKKEQKEQYQKQRRLERKIDHLERAKRLEEIPLLEKEYEKWREIDKKMWDECERQRIADVRAECELAKTLSQRLAKMKEDAQKFAAVVNEAHQATFESRIADFEAKIEQERAARLDALRAKRRQERIEKEQAEEARRKSEASRIFPVSQPTPAAKPELPSLFPSSRSAPASKPDLPRIFPASRAEPASKPDLPRIFPTSQAAPSSRPELPRIFPSSRNEPLSKPEPSRIFPSSQGAAPIKREAPRIFPSSRVLPHQGPPPQGPPPVGPPPPQQMQGPPPNQPGAAPLRERPPVNKSADFDSNWRVKRDPRPAQTRPSGGAPEGSWR